METNFTLQSQKHFKAFSHPLRLAILRLLATEAKTNEELAKALGVASGKLYFHTKTLLEAGLIEPAGTREKGHLTEKLYRTVAQQFVASPTLDGSAPPLEALVSGGLALYRTSWEAREAREVSGQQHFGELGAHLVLPHLPEQRAAFEKALRELFHNFKETAVAPDTPGAEPLALSFLFHQVPNNKPEEESK
jgi:DNA-binding transcriptional ArsR family regulator